MKTLELDKAKHSFARYAHSARREPVIVTRNGKPYGALVSLSNTDMETVSLSGNPKFLALIERSTRRYKKEGGLTTEDMRKRLGLKPAAKRKNGRRG